VDKQQFDATVKRLKDVNAIIKTLDPALRGEAVGILRPYIDGDGAAAAATDGKKKAGSSASTPNTADLSAFVKGATVGKPHEAVYVVAAWWFSQYGSAPFGVPDVRAFGDQVGYTLPDRIDKTLLAAKDEGKALFRRTGRGLWAPTVQGELWLKDEYGVTKGTKRPPGGTDES
jgi:hypothetical protein